MSSCCPKTYHSSEWRLFCLPGCSQSNVENWDPDGGRDSVDPFLTETPDKKCHQSF